MKNDTENDSIMMFRLPDECEFKHLSATNGEEVRKLIEKYINIIGSKLSADSAIVKSLDDYELPKSLIAILKHLDLLNDLLFSSYDGKKKLKNTLILNKVKTMIIISKPRGYMISQKLIRQITSLRKGRDASLYQKRSF